MRGAVLLVILVGLAGCSGGGFEPVDAPLWVVGTWWEHEMSYSTTGSLAITVNGEPLQDEWQDDWGDMDGFASHERMQVVEVVGEGHPLLGGLEPFYLVATSTTISWAGEDDEWGSYEQDAWDSYQGVRMRDLDWLPLAIRASNGVITEIEMWFPAPPGPLMQFPLRAGATWQYDFGALADEAADEEWFLPTVQMRVQGMETVTTPAGTFQAVAVRAEVDASQEAWAADILGTCYDCEGEVEIHRFDMEQYVTFLYAPELGYFGQVTMVMAMDIDIEAVDEEGNRIRIVGDPGISMAQDLVAFGHDELPPLQVAPDIVPPVAPLPAVPEEAEELLPARIVPATAKLNAPDGGSETFTVENGDGYYTWELRDADGERIRRTSGTSFTFTPDMAGRYTVEALGHEPRTIASVVVDHVESIDFSCTVTVTPVDTCPGHHVALGPGLAAGQLSVDAASLGLVGLPGTLGLHGPESHTQDTLNGQAEIVVETLQPGTYNLVFDPVAGVLVEGVFDIAFTYGEPTAVEASPPALRLPSLAPFWAR